MMWNRAFSVFFFMSFLLATLQAYGVREIIVTETDYSYIVTSFSDFGQVDFGEVSNKYQYNNVIRQLCKGSLEPLKIIVQPGHIVFYMDNKGSRIEYFGVTPDGQERVIDLIDDDNVIKHIRQCFLKKRLPSSDPLVPETSSGDGKLLKILYSVNESELFSLQAQLEKKGLTPPKFFEVSEISCITRASNPKVFYIVYKNSIANERRFPAINIKKEDAMDRLKEG